MTRRLWKGPFQGKDRGNAVCGLDLLFDMCNSSVSSFISNPQWAQGLLVSVMSAVFSLVVISLQNLLASLTIFSLEPLFLPTSL